MTKVVLEGFIIVPDLDIEIVKCELPKHTELTLNESGCLTFNVMPDELNPNKFYVYEEFMNQAAFEKHQARVTSSRWGEVTKNVERHYKISTAK